MRPAFAALASELRGKHVLLDFGASWCVPCVAEFSHLKELYETYRSRGFQILGLNRDESAAPARAMIREKQLPWINATPESVKEVVLQRFRALEIPVIVLLDPEGRVVIRGIPGMTGLRKEELTAMLEKRLPAKEAGR